MTNSSIRPVDSILSDATSLAQSGPGSNGNKREYRIVQSSSITTAVSSYCLVL